MSKAASLVLLFNIVALFAEAQQGAPQPMGAVATRDARVAGGLEVVGDTARLLTNASVTAYNHAAPIALNRGGHVLVCSTSEFHLLRSGSGGALIFGLDRGAMEISSASKPQDVVLTPDLKLTPVTSGPLDLRLRVTVEGDTCVDNEGAAAPVLNVTDAFSSATYRLLPGQHVLFVKADLHKVVDREQSPCGCPPAAFAPLVAGKTASGAQQGAAAAHPFPEAQSEGLAPGSSAGNAAPEGTAASQVTTTFSYDNGQGAPPPASAGTARSASSAASTPPAQGGGFFHAIGHFFRRLFHPS